MTDARDLFSRYLEQRRELGERILPLGDAGRLGRSEPNDDNIAPPTSGKAAAPAAAASPESSRARASRGGSKSDERWRRDLPTIPPAGIAVPAPTKDLFASDPLDQVDLEGVAGLVRECPKCRLSRTRTNAVPGEGPLDARLVVVGEGPGAKEDETGRPFVGRAGELLNDILAAIGLQREQVYICNIVKCRPPENRKPQPDEIAACVPYLHRQLAVIAPAVILAMGGTAAETLLGVRQSLGQLRNKVHRFRGIPLIVTYHPAALLRNPHWKKPTWDDVRIARQLLDQSV